MLKVIISSKVNSTLFIKHFKTSHTRTKVLYTCITNKIYKKIYIKTKKLSQKKTLKQEQSSCWDECLGKWVLKKDSESISLNFKNMIGQHHRENLMASSGEPYFLNASETLAQTTQKQPNKKDQKGQGQE